MSEVSLVGVRLIVVAFILVVGMSGCNSFPITYETGKFREITRCDRELKRGVSTKEDVLRMFGPPDGYGSSIFAEGTMIREIWFYYDLRTVFGTASVHSGVNVNQQALMVFFDKEFFDGYLRYANEELLLGHLGSK